MKRIRFTPPLVKEINITPLLDTAMTLLLIFIIISPIISQGVPVRLPTAEGEKMPVSATVILTLNREGQVFLGGKLVNPVFLPVDLKRFKETSPELKVIIQADRDVRYAAVVSLLDTVRRAGISAVGLATTSLQEENIRL